MFRKTGDGYGHQIFTPTYIFELLPILEVPGSNLGPQTAHSFPHSLNENVEIQLAVDPRPLVSTNFEINYCENSKGNITKII
jgi:hypothetical protein